MHKEYGWQIPERTVQWFSKATIVFHQQCANQGAHGLEEIRHSPSAKVKLYQPIWINDDIIYNIRYDEAVPVFLPILLVATPVFFQIARDKDEDHRKPR